MDRGKFFGTTKKQLHQAEQFAPEYSPGQKEAIVKKLRDALQPHVPKMPPAKFFEQVANTLTHLGNVLPISATRLRLKQPFDDTKNLEKKLIKCTAIITKKGKCTLSCS